MIEIDIAKASNHHHHLHNKQSIPTIPSPSLFYQNDDTDISEPDTALNTPTGSMMNADGGGYSRPKRYSSSSSTTSYNKRRPSFTPKSASPLEYLPSSPPPPAQQQQPQQLLVEMLEKKVQALENNLSQYIQREMDLESKLLILTEKQNQGPSNKYKSTLSRVGKQIDQFLVTQQQHNNRQQGVLDSNKIKSGNCWVNSGSWSGMEISSLYETFVESGNSSSFTSSTTTAKDVDNTIIQDNEKCATTIISLTKTAAAAAANTSSTTAIPILLVYRLRSMIDDFALALGNNTAPTATLKNQEPNTTKMAAPTTTSNFISELYHSLDSWQEYYNTTMDTEREKKIQEQGRVSRLLQALQKSLLKNKIMKQDYELVIKKYKTDMKHLTKQVETKILEQQQQQQQTQKQKEEKQQQETGDGGTIFNQSRLSLLEKHLCALEKKLHECQDERDEYETTLEMMRREMQTMLEELEDTRQQRVRYKTQASRLRAGLEAIQKKKKKMVAAASNNNSSSSDENEDEEEEEEEEDEAREAIRLMYNEAERQAIDLDRECKRQTLSLNTVRQELKQTEEKYYVIKSEKNSELKKLQRINEKLSRDIEMLQLGQYELRTLQQQQQQQNLMSSSSDSTTTKVSSISNEEANKDNVNNDARIYALQIALKAAKSEATIQHAKLAQLERQSALANLDDTFIIELQNLFQKELAAVAFSSSSATTITKDMAKIIQVEQKIWKSETSKMIQKQYDVDLLRVNREIRFLSCKLAEAEDEETVNEARHLEEISLLKYQSNMELDKKLQQQTSKYRTKQQELQDQMEILYQKNRTLQEESLILYGRNMLMAQKLGKIVE